MKTRFYLTVKGYEKPDTFLFKDLPEICIPTLATNMSNTYVEVCSTTEYPIRSKMGHSVVVLEPEIVFKVYLENVYVNSPFEETLGKIYEAGWSRVCKGDE